MADKTHHPHTRERASDGSLDELAVHKRNGGKLKRHCRRFWWLDLIIAIIIILVILLPVIFVAIPKKAQHDLNESTLQVTLQEVTSPASDGIHLKLVSTARSSSKYHPTVRAFRAALSLEGKEPFLYIDVPETKANAEAEIIVNEDLKFPSLDQFVDYNKAVMGSEEFVVHMDGKTKLKLGGLPSMSVNYNKKVTLKGLNKLNGLNITDLKILWGAQNLLADGSNLIGNITIPNPSVYALDLGNVTMDLAVDGQNIGYSLLPNLRLNPGENKVPMQSTITNLLGMVTLIQTKYTNAIIPLDIVGNSSIFNGQHLTYYEAAIKANTIRVDLNVGPALKALNLTGLF
jgi:hypothetical protein